MATNTFPTDYPERDDLARGGITTRELVRSTSDDELVKKTGISKTGVRAIREYEKAHPEPSTPPQPPPPPASQPPARQQASQPAAVAPLAPSQTERLSFTEAYMYKGITYGPGANIEVPKGLADSLRKRNLVGEGGQVLSQSPVGATLAATPIYVAPDQNFASEQLASGFPGRELLASKGVTTRSELMRMSDVDLLNVGATRELIGQIREALRMTLPVR